MTDATHSTDGTSAVGAAERSKRGFWILIGVLALSGVAIAVVVALGLFDSITYSLAWRVFVADLYLIASLAAHHTWLRRAVWIGAGITFVLGVVNVAWEYTPYDEWADGRSSYTYGDPSTGWSPWFGFEADLEWAGHFIVGGLVLLGFISFAYRWLVNSRLLRTIYFATFGVALSVLVLGTVLILDSQARLNLDDAWQQLQMGLVILALTGAAIVIIAGATQRSAARAAERSGQGTGPGATQLAYGPGTPGLPESATLAHLTEEELRLLVRKHVDEYLRERGV